jgi:hypothetical protein
MNQLKNRNFGKEDLQNFHLEEGLLPKRQVLSENKNSEETLTMPKTDSSTCFGIEIPFQRP